MAITSDRLKKGRVPVVKKPHNPMRIHMSYDEVVAQQQKDKEKAILMAEAEAKINDQLGITKVESSEPVAQGGTFDGTPEDEPIKRRPGRPAKSPKELREE